MDSRVPQVDFSTHDTEQGLASARPEASVRRRASVATNDFRDQLRQQLDRDEGAHSRRCSPGTFCHGGHSHATLWCRAAVPSCSQHCAHGQHQTQTELVSELFRQAPCPWICVQR